MQGSVEVADSVEIFVSQCSAAAHEAGPWELQGLMETELGAPGTVLRGIKLRVPRDVEDEGGCVDDMTVNHFADLGRKVEKSRILSLVYQILRGW